MDQQYVVSVHKLFVQHKFSREILLKKIKATYDTL